MCKDKEVIFNYLVPEECHLKIDAAIEQFRTKDGIYVYSQEQLVGMYNQLIDQFDFN